MPSRETVDAWLNALTEKSEEDEDLAEFLDDYSGYQGYDFLSEAQSVLALMLTGKTAWSADQTTSPIASLAGHEFSLDADWTLDGDDLIGFQVGTATATGVGVLYTSVWADLRDITEDRDAEGIEAVRGYAHALNTQLERLIACRKALGID